MKSIAILIFALFISTGMGCASFGQNQDAAKLATQYATLKVIDGDAERAARISAVIADTLEVLDNSAITVAAVESAVREQIEWSELDPADTLLANALIESVRIELEARVGSGALDEEQTVRVRAVLMWISDAAKLI